MPRVEVLTEASGRDPEATPAEHTPPAMLAGNDDADQLVEVVGGWLVDAERRVTESHAHDRGSAVGAPARSVRAGDLAKGLNLNPGSVSSRLTQLATAGEIKRASHGYSTKQPPRPRGLERERRSLSPSASVRLARR
jgi:hypothetical protein